MTTDEIISMAQLVRNGFTSQVDGQTPGHRVFGRAPRLPIPTAETATIFDISNAKYGELAPETSTQKFNAMLTKFRTIYVQMNTSNKVIKSLYHHNRQRDEENFRIGQSVFFFSR